MKYITILLVFFPILIVSSCKSTQKTEKTTSIKSTQQTVKKLIVDKNFDFINYKKEFTVKTASIIDSTLSITFTYIGCSDDELDLLFNGNYLKSLPPKASLNIIKKSGIKDCGKKVEKTLKFNIASVQYPSTKSIILQFANYEPKLIYNY